MNGTPSYLAWHEMYPAGPTEELTVNPGDAITSSVTCNGSGNHTMALTDLTSQAGVHGGLTSTSWGTVESVALGGATGGIDTRPGPLYKVGKQSAFPITWIQQN